MKIINKLKGWISSSPEEIRGASDSVQDLLSIRLPAGRVRFLYFIIVFSFLVLIGRLAYLQLGFNTDFLQKQGEMRFQRTLDVSAVRGRILDRNGAVLASSVPGKGLWIIPPDTNITEDQLQKLSQLLKIPKQELKKKFSSKRTFVYLKRQVPNDVANEVLALNIAGLHSTREYLRQYPDGIIAAQIVGLTGIDGNGVEGVELSADKKLTGTTGSRRVMKDRLGRIIDDVWIKEPQNGEDVHLTIDTRIQYLAYSALEKQVKDLNAKAGAVVVADPHTGDILALANYPSFDPNARRKISRQAIRNRAITDTYEPGSTMKPFSVAAGLEEKKVTPNTLFQIGHRMTFGRRSIGDSHYSKELTVAGIIQQSSNIGTSKVALLMSPQTMWSYYDKLGFGRAPNIGFPGAAPGRLRPAKSWRPIEQATMSYGYGVTVSLLQLVQAYTAIARNGDMVSLSIMKDRPLVEPQIVYSPRTANQMKAMLASVVEKGGTGTRASVEGFSVAGKTGTAYKLEGGQYVKKYVASFTGYAPASNPRVVVGVMIDKPIRGRHWGSTAAAPLFSQIVAGSLRILAVNPDKAVTPKGAYVKNEPKQQVKDKAAKAVAQSRTKNAAPRHVSNKNSPAKNKHNIRTANDAGKGLKKETGGA